MRAGFPQPYSWHGLAISICVLTYILPCAQKERGPRGRGRDGDRDSRSDGFEESVLNISRVCKVVKGGRHVAFRADVVVGNQKGLVRPCSASLVADEGCSCFAAACLPRARCCCCCLWAQELTS